jgi:two-component system, cell cycle sensor histidine kinase and response regulator CckA
MAHGPGGTILVVDDNPDIRGLARIFLENAGYTVVVAADGADGLRSYRENQSSILLLLTDITMPKMDGMELARCVLAIDSRLPVLVMSGEARGACLGLESIAKPFRPAELIERVGRALDARANAERTLSAA